MAASSNDRQPSRLFVLASLRALDLDPTPGTLAVCGVPGRYGCGVLYVILRLLSRRWERGAGRVSARVSRRVRRAVPRSAGPGWRDGSSFLAGSNLGGVLRVAGREYGDLGFPGDGPLGRGRVREFR